MELPKDVHYLIVRHLPIDLRIALKVKPGKVRASEEVKKEIARMAKVANHPNKLRFTNVRTDKGVERMIVVHGWWHEGYIVYVDGEMTFREYEPFQYYYAISEDRRYYWGLESQRKFSSFHVGTLRNDMFFYYEDQMKEYERAGGPC